MGLFYSTPEPRRGTLRLIASELTTASRTAIVTSIDRLRAGSIRGNGTLIGHSLVVASTLAFALLGTLPVLAADSDTTTQPSDSVSSTDSTAASDSTVELDVTNANMLAVVEFLRKPGGTQFIVAGDPSKFGPVTLHLRAPMDKVLQYVAQSAGATISKDEYGVYTIRPAQPGDTSPMMVAPSATPDSGNTEPVAQDDSSEPKRWETINLEYVEPTFIMSVLNEKARSITSPYGDNDAPAMGPAAPPNASPITIMDPWTGNGKSVQTTPNATDNVQPGVPLASATGTDATNAANRAVTTVGYTADQFPGGAPGGFNGGGGFGGNGGGGGGAAGGAAVSLRPAGVDQIIAITEQNTLLVRGTSQGIAELRDIIQKLDVPAKQVQIKVEFVTASVDTVDQLGISFDLLPFPSVETGFFPPGPSGSGSTFLSFARGNLVAQLAALLETSKGKVIASPMITLTNNIQGNISVTTQIPYSQTTTIAQGSGNALSAQTTSFLNVVTGLGARARVNGDNSVTLQLQPQLSNVGVAPASGPPPVTSQTVQTIRTVGNGETLVLGGLVQKTDTNAQTKYPILGDLPILGNLFRSRNNSVADSELLIFVTPTILPIPGSTTTGETVAPIQEGINGVATVGTGVTP